jgi:hypothetical protein
MKLCVLLLTALLAASASAETLDDWLEEQVRKDERMIADSVSQVGGHSLALLKDSRTYVPFFLEAPTSTEFASADQKASFDAWIENSKSGFLPGGYIYRLSFTAAPPLYATTAGEWSGTVWRSLDLGKDITLDPKHAWSGTNANHLYATLLPGVRPRLLIYDERGELEQQEVFDASSKDFEQRLDAALKRYSENKRPVLEMISLAEYLENRDAPWRPADISGQFNLRNQQQRPDEQKWLRQSSQLTRTATIDLLRSAQESTPSISPSVTPASMTPAPAAMPAASPSSTAQETEPSRSFPIVLVAILVAVIVKIVLYIFRRKSA